MVEERHVDVQAGGRRMETGSPRWAIDKVPAIQRALHFGAIPITTSFPPSRLPLSLSVPLEEPCRRDSRGDNRLPQPSPSPPSQLSSVASLPLSPYRLPGLANRFMHHRHIASTNAAAFRAATGFLGAICLLSLPVPFAGQYFRCVVVFSLWVWARDQFVSFFVVQCRVYASPSLCSRVLGFGSHSSCFVVQWRGLCIALTLFQGFRFWVAFKLHCIRVDEVGMEWNVSSRRCGFPGNS